MASDGKVIIDVDIDTKPLEKGLENVKDDLKDGGKQASIFGDLLKANLASEAIIGGVKALSGAISSIASSLFGLGKQALMAGGDLEQSLGGIETLFKDTSDIVVANAERAYLTAGVSANDYMQQVTSFSARLLQSLGSDTVEAAAVADMAIIDMADNANKFGSTIESIQNAYQGFAKQNYTMLDNLKLGYGGTRTEMERLLADAELLSGKEYDISNLNEVYEAIHVIQTELGVTGTTAKEGMETLTGALATTKAAFDNFISGASDVTGFIDAFTNLGEIVVDRIQALAPTLIDGLAQIITEGTLFIAGKAPEFIEMGGEFLSSIVQGFADNKDELFEAVEDIGRTLLESFLPEDSADSIIEGLGNILQGFMDIANTVIESGLLNNIANLFGVIIDIVVQVGAELTKAFGGDTVDMITIVSHVVEELVDALRFMAPVLVPLLAAYAAWTLAQWAINAALSANPIGVVVVAIAALVGAITYLWNTNEDFRVALLTEWAHILNFFDGVPLYFQKMGNGIADAFSHAKTFVLNIMQSMINGIIDIVNFGINALNVLPGVSLDLLEHATFATENAVDEAIARSKRADDYAKQSIENTEKAEKRITDLKAQAKAAGKETAEIYTSGIKQGLMPEFEEDVFFPPPEEFKQPGIEAGTAYTSGMVSGISSGKSEAVEAAEELTKEIESLHKDLMKAQEAIYKEDLKNYEDNLNQQLKSLDEATKEKKSLYAEERDARLEAAGVEAAEVDASLQTRIDAIEAERDARKRAEMLQREELAILQAETYEERERLIRQRDERILQEEESAQIESLKAEQRANAAKLKETQAAIKKETEEKIKQLEDDAKIRRESLEQLINDKKAETAEKLKEENLYHEASQLLLEGNNVKIQSILKAGGIKQSEIAKQNGQNIIDSITQGLDAGIPAFDAKIAEIARKLAEIQASQQTAQTANVNQTAASVASTSTTPQTASVVNITQNNTIVAQETPSETYRALGNITNDLVLGF